MLETKYIWMDGKLTHWKDAKVHVLTHSLHYGSGVFEGIRYYYTDNGSAVFRLSDHISRLFNSANTINMRIPFSEEEIVAAVIETVGINEIKSGYIRPIAFFGYGKMGLKPEGAPVNLSIAVWPWETYLGAYPVKIKTSSFIKIHQKSSSTESKITGNYINSILASIEATSSGYDEALLLDSAGKIAEGPGENIFIVRNGALYTPPIGNILPGITRDTVITLAGDADYEVYETPLTLEDIYDADEAFFTGTAAEITSIAKVDNVALKNSNGTVTIKIRETYLDVVQGKNSDYENWLSFVD